MCKISLIVSQDQGKSRDMQYFGDGAQFDGS